ncbi:DinB family protein [Caenibacillus caldisaponilyticus]|uniref:DinB family protein n=1 Tax=Caenibacillus caldisaponilyticus TaxID=1674942 RepID=UPI001EE69678|nr:DinB family protein [Caenibacillus caldisaponilyticus]
MDEKRRAWGAHFRGGKSPVRLDPSRRNPEAPAEKRLDEFLDLLAETMALVESVYRHMPDDVFTTADRPLGEENVSPEWVLYNLLDHEANHRGQIAMMKRILRTE